MMLPGVELARKRRVHHHGEAAPPQQRGSLLDAGSPRRPFGERASAMDEVAQLARHRLEEKLRRFDAATSPPTSSHHRLSRWLRHIVGVVVVETPNQADDAKSTEGILSRRQSRDSSRIDVCTVCLDEILVGAETLSGKRAMLLPCSHKYHYECLMPWLSAKSNCPCCRTVVPSINLLASERI